jgi:transcriptional regulator with XRE-family HTH domain
VDIRQRLGRNVRALRTAAGLSQEELAGRAGLHRTYESDIERGTRNPSIAVVERIAMVLNVTPGSLLD